MSSEAGRKGSSRGEQMRHRRAAFRQTTGFRTRDRSAAELTGLDGGTPSTFTLAAALRNRSASQGNCGSLATSLLKKCKPRCRWSALNVDTTPTWAIAPSGGQISAIWRTFDCRLGGSREPSDPCNRLLRDGSRNWRHLPLPLPRSPPAQNEPFAWIDLDERTTASPSSEFRVSRPPGCLGLRQ